MANENYVSYAKTYNPTEHLAADKITLLFNVSYLQTIYVKQTQMVLDENLRYMHIR
jgi:hypothetical protein